MKNTHYTHSDIPKGGLVYMIQKIYGTAECEKANTWLKVVKLVKSLEENEGTTAVTSPKKGTVLVKLTTTKRWYHTWLFFFRPPFFVFVVCLAFNRFVLFFAQPSAFSVRCCSPLLRPFFCSFGFFSLIQFFSIHYTSRSKCHFTLFNH